MTNNKGKRTTQQAETAAEVVQREQQRQTDVVAASIVDPANQSGVDATNLTTALLSSLSDPDSTAELQSSYIRELPSSNTGRAKLLSYSRPQREQEGSSDLPQGSSSLSAAAATAAVPIVVDDDSLVAPDQELPAFDRSNSSSPKRKRGGLTLSYDEYLAQQAPPPPPPKETRDERRRKIAFVTRANATAEKTKALLLAKGKVNPTDDDLIAAIIKLESFDKRQKLTSSAAERQAKEQDRIRSLPPLKHPRRAVDLKKAELHYGRDKFHELLDRCANGKPDHSPRGRSATDLPEGFFSKEFLHGKWVVDESGAPTCWRPIFYPHGYFDGESGRWIGNLTPDKQRIYRRDGTVGPVYSGSN